MNSFNGMLTLGLLLGSLLVGIMAERAMPQKDEPVNPPPPPGPITQVPPPAMLCQLGVICQDIQQSEGWRSP